MMSNYTVRELILYLLDFNMEAPIHLNALYEESDGLHISWSNECETSNVLESKKECACVFFETVSRFEEGIEESRE